MSSRALKKLSLQGKSDIPLIEGDSNTDDDTSSPATVNKAKFNRYNLLHDDTQSESEAKEHDDEIIESLNLSDNNTDTKETKRKKKRKKKRSNRYSSNPRSSEDNVEDEIDRSVREVNKLLGNEEQQKTEDSKSKDIENWITADIAVLKVEARHLNPNNEFKRMFGSKIVRKSAEFKRKPRGRFVKNTTLVIPKETWMPITKQGISMKLTERKNCCASFTFEHSYSYQDVQRKFLTAVSSLTPDDIVNIINDYPYHVDALIQLSDLCKVGEDYAMAADLIERAIYALEMAFHPSFNICRGDCRLPYIRQENRSFYVAVLKHIQFVGQRACHRTALELCKMLLSLNPVEDPIALVLSIDYYALRAKEYKWLIEFTQAWNSTKHLTKLPNFKYSIALAHWYTNDSETADKLLKDALILFPSFLKRLADKCNIQLDSRVQSHSFFTSASDSTETKPLCCLVTLYVERCQHIWKYAELLPWLEKNVHAVLDMVDADDAQITDGKSKRTTWFKPNLPINIKRHLLIHDMTDILALSGERMPGTILCFDPYPPANSVNLYSLPSRPILSLQRRTGMLALLLQSINPNVHYEGPNEQELENLAERIGEVNQELRLNLHSIVNSIRGLLTTFESAITPGTVSAGASISADASTQIEMDEENSNSDETDNVESSEEYNDAL